MYRNFKSAEKICVLNLFAYRATNPANVENRRSCYGFNSIVGDRNDEIITNMVVESGHVIVAWGDESGIDEVDYCRRIQDVPVILYPHRDKLWYVKGLTLRGPPIPPATVGVCLTEGCDHHVN